MRHLLPSLLLLPTLLWAAPAQAQLEFTVNTQVDLADGRRSGLRQVGHVLRDVEGVGFVELTGKDVVRHRIVAAIVEAYRQYEENLGRK